MTATTLLNPTAIADELCALPADRHGIAEARRLLHLLDLSRGALRAVLGELSSTDGPRYTRPQLADAIVDLAVGFRADANRTCPVSQTGR